MSINLDAILTEKKLPLRGKFVTTIADYDIYHSDELNYSVWHDDEFIDDNFQSVECILISMSKSGLVNI